MQQPSLIVCLSVRLQGMFVCLKNKEWIGHFRGVLRSAKSRESFTAASGIYKDLPGEAGKLTEEHKCWLSKHSGGIIFIPTQWLTEGARYFRPLNTRVLKKVKEKNAFILSCFSPLVLIFY